MKDAIEQEIKWCEENRGINSKEFEDGFIAGLKQAIFITNAAEQFMPNLVTTSKRLLEWAQSLPIVIPAGLESDMQEAIENFTVEEVLENTLAPDRLTAWAGVVNFYQCYLAGGGSCDHRMKLPR